MASSENPNEKTPLYPSIDASDLENLFPHITTTAGDGVPSAPPAATEEVLITVPGVILHLIDKEYSVELACGDFTIVRLRHDENVVAVYAVVAGEIQWPLAKDEAAVKVDDSRYFFSLRVPKHHKEGSSDSSSSDEDRRPEASTATAKTDDSSSTAVAAVLSYGLTIASKGQEDLLRQLDEVLKECSCFSVHEVTSEDAKKEGEALDGSVAKEISPADLESENGKKELMAERSAAYWTTLAPNVEDYSSTAARLIATGSGQLVKGILWCGDVTVERLKWGNEFMKKRIAGNTTTTISPQTLKKIKRVKRVTKMTKKVANGVLCGVVKVSGFFTSSVANSKAGKKIFKLLPGEVVLATLDGFSKVCDAVEVAGKNVMATSSTVTTELVQHRYGEEAAKATSEGLVAAGHAVGTAWAAFKIRQAFNPKSVLKPTALAKTAAAELKKAEKKSKK